MPNRNLVERFVLEPATGKAVPVKRGQVLTITQIADGQCLDLNVYNLADPREHLHSGRTRGMGGVNPTVGSHLWSAPPWERPMMTIIEDTVKTNDVNYSRCSAFLYEYHYGFSDAVPHSNCHDCFTEAVREWGLRTDQVHDSFNGFMNTRVVNGRLAIDRMVARKGDCLSFLAQMDVLAVPICCGGDLGATNNYELKGLEVSVWEGSDADQRSMVEKTFHHQRTLGADGVALTKDPEFAAHWPWLDRVASEIDLGVDLSDEDLVHLTELNTHPHFADLSAADFLRFTFFQWLERHHRRPASAF